MKRIFKKENRDTPRTIDFFLTIIGVISAIFGILSYIESRISNSSKRSEDIKYLSYNIPQDGEQNLIGFGYDEETEEEDEEEKQIGF